ncbi:hypothetical protein [Nitratireductor luteus]|uniref:hypothetical protein n=1 Tax=Nitratireductor luteus TaxID=2976980 RepID=UPI002240776A|nr:hypothetical protein [Nitratireductor luteus]
MEAVRTAIRKAFEKGDPGDRVFREKVYRQVFAAFERSLAARPDISAEDMRLRRDRLKSVITEVESEFVPAREPQAPAAPPPYATEATFPPQQETRGAFPRVARDDRLSEADDIAPEPAYDERTPMAGPVPRRRSFAMLFLIATLVAAIGIGAWWTIDSGILMTASERDTSVRNPPANTEEESFDPGGSAPARPALGAAEPTGDWVTVFTPSDPTTAAAAGGARAEVVEGDQQALRVSAPGADTAVLFDVGQGTLERLAGRRAVFSLTASAEEGQETQISISCNFGDLGDCGRIRYVVGAAPGEYLFETEFPDRPPGAGGTIAIVPDIEGLGRSLDIYSIRVSPAG